MTDQERSTLAQWVKDYTAPLLQRARYLLSDDEEAQDLVQETFLAACSALPSFSGKSTPLTWLTQILRHKAMDRYRQRYRGEATISLDQFFDETGAWRDTSVLLPWDDEAETASLRTNEAFASAFTACLEALPEKWKQVLKLYYLAEEEAKVICQDLALTPTYLWKLLQRGRLQMRACLDAHWFHA